MFNLDITRSAPIFGAPLIIKDGAQPDDDPIKKAVDDLTKEFGDFRTKQDGRLDDLEKKNLAKVVGRLDQLEAKLNRPGAGGTSGDDTELDLERKALNLLLRGGVAALDDIERKALNLGTPSAGGYAVAPEYSREIIERVTEFSPLRSLATVMSIGTTEIYFPVVTGKLAGGWVTETGPRPESQPVFDQANIKTFEHAVIIPISAQLLEDAVVDLSAFLESQIGQQFGKAEATAFVDGDGNGKPTGFLNDPDLFESVTANQSGADILDKIIETFYALPTAYSAKAAWLMNRRSMGIIRKAADNATKGTLWSDSLANGQPATLLGRPVHEAIDMGDLDGEAASPTTDPTFPVALGDWATGYRIVDRIGVQIMRDDFTGADNGIVKIRARRRVGGKTVQPEAIVLMKGVVS